MDRITTVLKSQWRAYWRRFRGSANLRASNAGAIVLIGGLGTVRFLQQLPLVAAQLSEGQTTRYETLVMIVFLAWMVPVMGESRRSISAGSLLHFPLTAFELFVIRVGSVFCSPLSWIIVVLSLALGLPLMSSEHPLPGLIGLIVFLLLGLFVSMTIAHLLQGAMARRMALVVLLVVSVAGGLIWLERQTQFAVGLRSLQPHRLAVAAAVSPSPLRAVAALIAITAGFAILAFWRFTLTLHAQKSRRSQRSGFATQLPGKFGGLTKKDLRYSSRLLDIYLVVPIVVLFNMFLPSDPTPSALAFSIVIGVLFFPCMSIAFNCFGLDSALGFDRYTLFPLSGRSTLLSKNVAFAALMVAPFATILPLAFWQLGPKVTFVGLMEFTATLLAYVACGNWFSVKQPYKMRFYRFASGGSLVDTVIGIMFASVPAALTVYLFAIEDAGAIWKIGGVLLLTVGLYLVSLSRAARALETGPEQIRRALS